MDLPMLPSALQPELIPVGDVAFAAARREDACGLRDRQAGERILGVYVQRRRALVFVVRKRIVPDVNVGRNRRRPLDLLPRRQER